MAETQLIVASESDTTTSWSIGKLAFLSLIFQYLTVFDDLKFGNQRAIFLG